MAITAGWIKRIAQDTVWVETTRERLCDLSWFMKFLKEPIARQANAEDKVPSAFWEGRFKSVAILDETSLLATMAYIDLNPVAANLAATPESSPHTSIKARIDHCASQGQLERVRTGNRYSLKENVETGLWLLPIQDRRNDSALPPSATHHSETEQDCPTSIPSAMVTNKAQQQSTEPADKAVQVSPRQRSLAGMLQGISLRGYLELLDWSSRLVRPGKASISTAAPPILERLRISEANWMDSDTAETLRPRKRPTAATSVQHRA